MQQENFTLKEAAAWGRVGVDTIAAAIKSGRLRAKRTGPNGTGKHVITIEALRKWRDEELEDA